MQPIDANGAAAGAGTFIWQTAVGAAFTGVAGQLHHRWENPTGTLNDKTIIEGDINGDWIADFQIEIPKLIGLSAIDFVL